MVSAEFASVLKQGVALLSRLSDLKLVVVDGTAVALHCDHRYSLDLNCVTPLLAERFAEVAEMLERWEGWKTIRKHPPFLILGSRGGIELGVRQQRRTVPLQIATVKGLVVPTPKEMLRVKAFLVAERRATRDFVDLAALSVQLGEGAALEALSYFNPVYADSGLQSPVTRLAEACESQPVDLNSIPLGSYKGLRAPFTNWRFVSEACQGLGRKLVKRELNDLLPKALAQDFFEPPA
jgi:hypothetical protein